MTEQTNNATQLLDFITAQAVTAVGKATQGQRMTEAQWSARVENTMNAMLSSELDRLAQEDPEAAQRITQQLIAGLEKSGRIE